MSAVEDVMLALRNCWCEQLGDTVDTCCLVAGVPVITDCCAGYAWVRLVGAYPSQAFPSALTSAERCRIDTWAIQVEVGVTRCAPEPCDITGSTCCDAEADAATILMADFARARRLFTCCLGDTLRGDEMIPGQWKVYGPEGGCIGATMQAVLFVSDSCGC